MKILCAGLREKDSGKSTLTLSLIKYFKEHGIAVCGFKPKSGNNIWYHWKKVKEGLDKGTIYGRDAAKYYDKCNRQIPITTINPIHRLWMPSFNDSYLEEIPNFILDRITIEETQIVALNTNVNIPIDKKYFNEIFNKSRIIKIEKRADLEQLTDLYEKADNWAIENLSKKVETIICESYANIGLPWNSISDLDYVFVIEPFKIDIYRGDRYLKASKIVSSVLIEQKTYEIIEPINPIESIKVPPFSNQVITNLKQHLDPYLDEII
ncbi:MAG: hypothetical protein EU541_05110 [Promethearchaeota archaeon]|nr:MAG: hypothetical protein EU541_05110 [Candidatus Lokiarchaeota archaeon]